MARKEAILNLKAILVRRRDALRSALAGDLTLLRELRSGEPGDVMDAALDSAQDEISSQLAEVESRELGSIEHALERMRDGGHYGPDGGNARLHRAFQEGIAAIQGRHPEWFPTVPLEFGRSTDEVVGGIGGMMRFTPFGGDKAKVMRLLHTMFEEGVIAFACGHGPYHVRFLPPVGVMRVEQFAPVMEIVERALARVAMEPAETA